MSKKMMPILLKIEPNGQTNKEQYTQGAEKFIFVLEGMVDIHLGDTTFSLSPKNTLYFDSSREHYFKNKSGQTAKIICVSTPVIL